MREDEKPWSPLSPAEVATVFADARFPWWIAGGLAVDHFVGRTLRPHGDVDVLVLRRDRAALRALLASWDCWASDPPGRLRTWPSGLALPVHVNDVWCRRDAASPWAFQILLDDGDRSRWRSRRCTDVTRPADELGSTAPDGIRFLAVEVLLYYKAGAPREKDRIDFDACLPLLSVGQRRWLHHAILVAYGRDNVWLARLETEPGTGLEE